MASSDEHLNNGTIIYNPSLQDAIENADTLGADNPGFNINPNGNNS
ncbi:MAG: hypothetical protein JJT96_12640 [Opitutales bacterium]|nr:hypothetical protein [Opitutales bacterium]